MTMITRKAAQKRFLTQVLTTLRMLGLKMMIIMFLEDAAYYEDQSDPRAVTHICLDECQLCQWGRWQVQKREKYQNTCQAKDQHLRATAQLQKTSFMMLVKNLTKMSPIQSYDQHSQYQHVYSGGQQDL